MANTLRHAAQTAESATKDPIDTSKWDAMNDEQKKQAFDALPEDKKQGKTTWYEWVKEGYHHQYENWMPWVEDLYLKWFTNDNKASYATRANLDKTKLSGNDQVDKLQDSINDTVAGQLGPGGMLQPVGDASSKEGVNRAERGGKDADGSYGGPVSSATDPVVGGVKGGASTVGNTIGKGAEGVSTLLKGSGEGKKDGATKEK